MHDSDRFWKNDKAYQEDPAFRQYVQEKMNPDGTIPVVLNREQLNYLAAEIAKRGRVLSRDLVSGGLVSVGIEEGRAMNRPTSGGFLASLLNNPQARGLLEQYMQSQPALPEGLISNLQAAAQAQDPVAAMMAVVGTPEAEASIAHAMKTPGAGLDMLQEVKTSLPAEAWPAFTQVLAQRLESDGSHQALTPLGRAIIYGEQP